MPGPMVTNAYDLNFSSSARRWEVEVAGPSLARRSYQIDVTDITHVFGVNMPPILADAVEVAVAVYAADRLIRRPVGGPGRIGWTRRFRLHLPLREPARWGEPALADSLRRLLWEYTEDDWVLQPQPRPADLDVGATQLLFAMPPTAPVTVALFSGGLDSLAGSCIDLAVRPTGSVVLVSGATNSRLMDRQRRLTADLRTILGREIIRVEIPLSLRQEGSPTGEERSQRSRGFLFALLGAVTARLAGTDELAIYENGVGAINLPYTGAQIGVHHTRATHPGTLAALAELIGQLTGRPFTIRSPFALTTKAALCARLADLGLSSLPALIDTTVSCDSFPLRLRGQPPECGYCTSCLLRRQALWAGGLGGLDLAGRYRIDVLQPGAVVPEQAYPLRVMLDQVEVLRRALSWPTPWLALAGAYPELASVARKLAGQNQQFTEIEQGLVDLYQSYTDEWARFPVPPVLAAASRVA